MPHMFFDPSYHSACVEAGKCASAFWWLGQPFGKLIFTLVFVTWGLVITWLSLSILVMIEKLTGNRKDEKKKKK